MGGGSAGRRWVRILWIVAIFAGLYGLKLLSERVPPSGSAAGERATPLESDGRHGGAAAIDRLFRERRSGVMVQSGGIVERLLTDDLEGSRHQRFIVRLPTGLTVLISHNIDLAPRVPVADGDGVRFRGQYEWNDRGGVVHWTHRDPDGGHAEGWIRHRDRLYE